MRNIIKFFIQYPIYSNAIIIITAIAGIFSLFMMPKSFFPEMSPNKIYVDVSYPGASPKEIEEGITTRIEESLNGIEGVKEITSRSSENVSNVTIEINEGDNIDEVLQDIKNAVDGIYSFPIGAEKPTIKKQRSRGMGGMSNVVGFYSLNGTDNLWELKQLADEIEKDLLNDDAISQLRVIGYPPIIISIEIKEDELLKRNLTFDIIANAIRRSNIDISAGSIKTNKDEIIIRSNNRSTDINKIKEIIIYSNINGDNIKLGEIANLKLEFSDIPIISYVDGKRAINFIVEKTPDEDLKEIANVIEKYKNNFNNKNKDYQISTLFQFSDLLDQRINTLTENLVIGLLLVLIVLGLFLSLKLSSWVAFGIPFSFIGMIGVGLMYGMTINMITLFGMIMVVGIIVDDGIVIAENIYSHFEKGKSPMDAALDGTMEVLKPVFTSVLTTILAFSTLLFIGGDLEMMEEMAFAVIICLCFSLIEAFLILPSHLSSKTVLNKGKSKLFRKIKIFVEDTVKKTKYLYTKLNTWIINRYRWHVWTPLLFIIIISTLMYFGHIRTTFFPSVPFDEVKIEFSYKPGEREFRTQNFLWYCNSIVEEYNQELIKKFNDTLITDVSLTVGFTEALGENGSHAGQMRLAIKENTLISTIDISNEIQKRINIDSINQLEKISVGGQQQFGKAVSISLQSEDSEELKNAVIWMKDKIIAMDQVKEVLDNGGVGNREMHLKLKEKAYNLGLDESTIMRQIRQGFFGEEVQRLIIGRDEVKIWLRYPMEDRNSIKDLNKVKIKTIKGETYPLEELATYKFIRGKVKIDHINGAKETRIDANLYNAELSGEVNSEIERKYLSKLNSIFPNVNYKIMGQAERAADSMNRLGIAFLISIILIMITLSLNFKSFYQARLILMLVPIGLFSAILGHGLMGIPFSTLSIWGVVALIGILVNDAVVMLDRYNKNLSEGMNMEDAAIQAGDSRFRAIILTTITTFVGLFPLILEKSFQSQFLIPMATSIAFGILFGTLILLLYFPSLILFFNDIRRVRFWLWNGGEEPPSKIEVEPFTKSVKRQKELQEKS